VTDPQTTTSPNQEPNTATQCTPTKPLIPSPNSDPDSRTDPALKTPSWSALTTRSHRHRLWFPALVLCADASGTSLAHALGRYRNPPLRLALAALHRCTHFPCLHSGGIFAMANVSAQLDLSLVVLSSPRFRVLGFGS
jgi:hypothetical protein